MGRADTRTLIPLDRAARYLGIDPWNFNQITTAARPIRSDCPAVWFQYDWQAYGKLSREGLAQAIRQAENMVTEYLHFSPISEWWEEELKITEFYRIEDFGVSTNRFRLFNSQFHPKSVPSTYKYVTETGQRTKSLIDTPATAFTDEDGDGVTDLCTISFATTVTDEQELHVYYPSKSGNDVWEIRPLTSISIAAGTATITFPKYMIPLEALMELPSSNPDDPHIGIDGEDDTNFLTEVDVYRVYANEEVQITFISDPFDICSDGSCDPYEETGCLFIKDSRRGILEYRRGDWSDGTFTAKSFTYRPYKAKIYYRAGWQDQHLDYPTREMDRALERMIVFYALSLLDEELCGCGNVRNIWKYLTVDMAKSTPERSFSIAWTDFSNSFGTTRAAFNLWKALRRIRIEA